MSKELLQSLLRLLIALIVALIVSSLFIIFMGENPLIAYRQLFKGAFVGKANIIRSLRWSTPYIITGVAAAVAFRAGGFNIGIEGCVYIGGLSAALVGVYVTGLPGPLHVALAVVVAMIMGGFWLVLPAFLRAFYNVNEVITTWMFSYISVLLCQYLVTYHFQDPFEISQSAQQVRTSYIASSARLSQLIPPFQLNTAIFIALGITILYYLFSQRTTLGYELEMTGLSPDFAKYGGINIAKIRFYAIIISGAIGAVAGATEIMGVHFRYIHGFSTAIGVNGILVALMGRLNPITVPLAAIFFGSLQNGARVMERTSNVSLDTINIMVSIIVMSITAEGLYELIRVKRKARKEE